MNRELIQPQLRRHYPKYTYSDPYLSLWQSAVKQVQASQIKKLVPNETAIPESVADLMAPVHALGNGRPQSAEGFAPTVAALAPVGDCAKAAAKFLWAEITRNHAQAQLLQDELKKAVCDAAGWSTCLATYLAFKAQGGDFPYRDHMNVVNQISDNVRIAIIGDWGTGEHSAASFLQEVKLQNPDLLIHLGDIYYSGTLQEAQQNFLELCRSIFGASFPLYTLCGNHDMYSGGKGYYWLLDQIGQQASYFALKNNNWLLLSMDTGHNDCNPLTVASNMTSLNATEVTWQLSQLYSNPNLRPILFSHHQLFSPFGAVGQVNGKNYAYNPNLYDNFKAVLNRVEWWFWGHEHTLGIYEPYMGLKRGRCIGCSAVPVFIDQQSYKMGAGLTTFDGGTPPRWSPNGQVGDNGTVYNNAFAILMLAGADAVVQYYDVPVDGKATALKVADNISSSTGAKT